MLTRSQLWQGLEMRARFPGKFNHSLQCSIEPISDYEFVRTTDVGDTRFCERVLLYPESEILTASVAEVKQIHAESRTCIEEPEADSLFVRFDYKRELDDRDDRVDLAEHLKAAYVQVDRDAIAMIRVLAEANLFDQLVN